MDVIVARKSGARNTRFLRLVDRSIPGSLREPPEPSRDIHHRATDGRTQHQKITHRGTSDHNQSTLSRPSNLLIGPDPSYASESRHLQVLKGRRFQCLILLDRQAADQQTSRQNVGFRDLISPIAFVRAGGFFENFLYGLQVAQGGMLSVYYNPTNRKSTMVATNDIGAEVATLLTGPAWSGQRVVELGSMVTADEVAEQLGEVLKLDVKAFAVPRAGWAKAFEQFGIPKGHTGSAEEMFEAVNAGWMDLGVEGTEHVAGTTSARDVFEAAQNAAKA
jgi:hypothetical protein